MFFKFGSLKQKLLNIFMRQFKFPVPRPQVNFEVVTFYSSPKLGAIQIILTDVTCLF